MPDDRDAEVGPAVDREDLFPSASSSDPTPAPGSDGPRWGAAGDGADPAAADATTTHDPAEPLFASPPPSGSQDDVNDAPPTEPARKPKPERSSTASFFRELPVLLLVAFLLAFLLRTFVLQVFFIPSGSMEPTLQVDDRMVVEKVTYRFRDPVRGEIVVFEGETFGEPDAGLSTGARVVRGVGQFLGLVPASARDYVKRVIGLPGDEILIEDGVVRVNGVTLDEPYVAFEDPSDYGPVTVPEGRLFFLGDNRPNSSDSRRSLGFVPEDAVIGRSVVIIWPWDNLTTLTEVEHEVPAA